MKQAILAALSATFLLSAWPVISVKAGPCTHPWDTASDGSRCGGRSSDSRPGGQ
jgi:hypothetical protein